jgi:hypothetical protein
MSNLELKKLEVELKRVDAARAELELRKEEALEQISKFEEHIEIQLKREAELKKLIEEMRNK